MVAELLRVPKQDEKIRQNVEDPVEKDPGFLQKQELLYLVLHLPQTTHPFPV